MSDFFILPDSTTLKPQHREEWQQSGVDEVLFSANVVSLIGDAVYEALYGLTEPERKNDGRLTDSTLRRYEQLAESGGWWFESVDPFTGNPNSYGCFKPDFPREIDGRRQKYESPYGAGPHPLFFKVPDSIWELNSDRYLVPKTGDDFYQWFLENPSIPIFVTEGAKKAGCLLSSGYFAVGIAGFTLQQKALPQLEAFLKDRVVYFALDQEVDSKLQKQIHVQIKKALGLVEEVNAYKVTWNPSDGKGVDDFIVGQGVESFITQVKRAKPISPIELTEEQERDSDKGLNKVQRLWKLLGKLYGDRLRFNELTREVELDNEVFEVDNFYIHLAGDHCLEISKNTTIDTVLEYAKLNTYHPVKDYLNNIAGSATFISIDDLATRYLGADDPLSNEMLKRHLIGSVARVFEPGCKKDEVLVLQGKQGFLKSTFLNKLYGESFFTDSVKGIDRDNLLILHRYWCCELAEIETITGKREAGELKAFISSKSDTFREPYARSSKERKRGSVLVATVNPDTFLVNDTGNRRFWTIPVQQPIDIELVERERDFIWEAAVAAYRNSESWWLPYECLAQVEARNKDYKHEDSRLDTLRLWLIGREFVTVKGILVECFGFDLSRIPKRDEMIVSNFLKEMGWQKGTESINSIRVKGWYRESSLRVPPSEVVLEVGHAETQSGQETVPPVPPTPPISKSFSKEVGEDSSPFVDEAQNTPEKNAEKVGYVGYVGQSQTAQGLQSVPPPRPPSEVVQGRWYRTEQDGIVKAVELEGDFIRVVPSGCPETADNLKWRNLSDLEVIEVA